MTSTVYTIPELAGLLGLSTRQIYGELQSFPHQGRIASDIRFTEDDVATVRKIRAAGPEEQVKRYQLLAEKRAAIRALDEQN